MLTQTVSVSKTGALILARLLTPPARLSPATLRKNLEPFFRGREPGAWEALFDRIDIRRPVPGAAPAVLIIGGAGGVGSIAIQLTRALTDLTVVATASRPETMAWVKELGAHHVIDHRKPIAAEVAALGIGSPGFVFSVTHTADHLKDIAELIAPQGRLALINNEPLDLASFMRKKRVSPLGVDVHALAHGDCRHGRAARAARAGRGSRRRGKNPNHDYGELRHHQCRKQADNLHH